MQVEATEGAAGEKLPVRFTLGQQDYQVTDVLDQWYNPRETFYKVLANDGSLYILRHTPQPPEDHWTLESFRR